MHFASSIMAQLETIDPVELLALAQAGNAQAYELLYRHFAPRLLRRAWLLCGNEALAEELAQDTLVEAWKSLPRYHGRCQFFTWLCAILLNRHRNSLRKNSLFQNSTVLSKDLNEARERLRELPDDGFGPDQTAELRDQSALIKRCIASLPEKQQQVVFLRFYADDSLDGIAAALGCSVGTVKSRLFHAMDKLRLMPELYDQWAESKTMRGPRGAWAACMVGLSLLLIAVIVQRHVTRLRRSAPPPPLQAENISSEMAPTFAIYRKAASLSLDRLDELLMQHGNQPLPPEASCKLSDLQ